MQHIILIVMMASVSFLTHAKAPQSAIDACEGLASGGACVVKTPRDSLNGICRQPPRESQLLCVPSHGRQQHSHGDTSAANKSGAQGSHTRQHTVIQSDGEINTVVANKDPITDSSLTITVQGDWRILESNGISVHLTGAFPNRGNPHEITEQRYRFKVPAFPKITTKITSLGMHDFGLGVNGVPFDPGAAEWYLGNRQSDWQYEAMSGAIALGLDENHAHVQPTGAYHYHGLPNLLVKRLAIDSSVHSPLVGWAADGFPIYSLYGYENADDEASDIVEMHSSYRLREGKRPDGVGNPGGYYDGTFVADYHYVQGAGDLDECNGRMTRTDEFPDGTYAYFLSNDFPIIPRCYKGTPSTDFTQQRGRQNRINNKN